MNVFFSKIRAYFEELARCHVAIRHRKDEPHFYRYELEEVLGSLKDVNYPALILESYQLSYEDHKSDNVMKMRRCSFILLDRVSDCGDFERIEKVQDELERIADDILLRMKHHKRAGNNIVRHFDLQSISGVLLHNEIDKNYGMRVQFVVGSPISTDEEACRWDES